MILTWVEIWVPDDSLDTTGILGQQQLQQQPLLFFVFPPKQLRDLGKLVVKIVAGHDEAGVDINSLEDAKVSIDDGIAVGW